HAGQHQVEQHDVGAVAVELVERGLAGPGHGGREALLAEQKGKRVGKGLFVLDDKHPGHGTPSRFTPEVDAWAKPAGSRRGWAGRGGGNRQGERGPDPGAAPQPHTTTVVGGDVLDDGEPEPGTAGGA